MIAHRIIGSVLLCLLLTVLLEGALAFLLGVRNRYGQLVVLLVNIITNPIMNSILTVVTFYLSPALYVCFLVPLEILVVLVEALIFKRTLSCRIPPLLFSLILNAGSYFIGTVILRIIH